MKFPSISVLVVLFALLVFSLNIGYAQVDDVSEDKFSMNIDGHTLKIPYYSNFDIFESNSDLIKAVIVIQGANRNAGPYLDNLVTAAKINSAATANTTLMVSPQFLIESDINHHSLDFEHLYWSSGGWKSGSTSKDEASNPRPKRISSYAVLDSLLLHIAKQFPSIKSIVLTGHSAGGQVTQRMAATTPMPDQLCMNYGISMRFVPLNPSSYVYMNGERKTEGSTTEFEVPPLGCFDYNDWKYGLSDLYTYPAQFGVDSIRNRNERRVVTYMVGEDDDNPNSSSLDTSCEGLLQGAQRLERGEVYFNYLQHYYGSTITDKQEFVPVPGAGHNSLEMFASFEGRVALFQKPSTSCGIKVGIEEAQEETIAVFPNPATDVLYLSSSFSNEDIQAKIFDLQGRLMSSQQVNQDKVNISALNSGMYLLLLQSENRSIYQKIVVD